MNARRLTILAIVSVVVVACTRADNTPVTTYKPADKGDVVGSIFAGGVVTHGIIEDAKSGYSSRQTAPGEYEVQASGTSTTTRERVIAIALRRATEIAHENNALAMLISKPHLRTECVGIRVGGTISPGNTIGARRIAILQIKLLQSAEVPEGIDPAYTYTTTKAATAKSNRLMSTSGTADAAREATRQANIASCHRKG